MNLDFNDENLINEGGPNKSDGVGKFLKNNISGGRLIKSQ